MELKEIVLEEMGLNNKSSLNQNRVIGMKKQIIGYRKQIEVLRDNIEILNDKIDKLKEFISQSSWQIVNTGIIIIPS